MEGEKSNFAVINFKWTSGKWKYEQPDANTSISVRDGTGNRERLKQLKPSEARRTLGVWQAADGNEKEQAKQLTGKANKWARAVARSLLTRHDIVLGMNMSLYPSITFGLMATTLNKQQSKEIFKPIRKGVLPKAGYAEKMPAIVVHRPNKYGGVGIKDLYTLQGIAQVKAFLDEAGRKSPTAQLLHTAVEGHIIKVGRSGNLFQLKYKEIQQEMTTSWIKSLLEFTSENGIQLQGKLPTIKTWRDNDSLLMEDIDKIQGTVINKKD